MFINKIRKVKAIIKKKARLKGKTGGNRFDDRILEGVTRDKERVGAIFKKRQKRKWSKRKVIGFILVFLGVCGMVSIMFCQGNFVLYKKGILSPISDQEPRTVELAKALNGLGIEIKGRILDNKGTLVVFLATGEEVWFEKDKSVEKQAASLQMILSRFRMEGKKVKKIDLRFEKPIILE